MAKAEMSNPGTSKASSFMAHSRNECIHGMSDPSWCAFCSPPPEPRPPRRRRTSASPRRTRPRATKVKALGPVPVPKPVLAGDALKHLPPPLKQKLPVGDPGLQGVQEA